MSGCGAWGNGGVGLGGQRRMSKSWKNLGPAGPNLVTLLVRDVPLPHPLGEALGPGRACRRRRLARCRRAPRMAANSSSLRLSAPAAPRRAVYSRSASARATGRAVRSTIAPTPSSADASCSSCSTSPRVDLAVGIVEPRRHAETGKRSPARFRQLEPPSHRPGRVRTCDHLQAEVEVVGGAGHRPDHREVELGERPRSARDVSEERHDAMAWASDRRRRRSGQVCGSTRRCRSRARAR